jgi:hypothetical protein
VPWQFVRSGTSNEGEEINVARSFRLYQKKRGNRRTGSDKFGSAQEALFFAVLLLLGCVGLVVLFLTLVIPEWRVNHEFVRQTCTVRGARVRQKESEDGTLYRPEVEIEYAVDGKTYVTWTYDIHNIRDNGYSPDRDGAQAIVDRFQRELQQQTVPLHNCWYDPEDPHNAVLVRRSAWWVWLSLIVPISFILLGAGGVAYTLFTWGKSAERCAAIARQAAHLDPFAGKGGARSDFPYIPAATQITDSPGTKLAFRLPSARSPVWALFAWLTVCLLWNGVVLVFAIIAIGGFLKGAPDWTLTAFVIPFVLIGIALIGFFLRQLVVTTAIGPTLVEISDQPLHPGQRYRLFLSQTGRLKMHWLELLLVCDEETTYRQGTDTRTERHRVCQRPLLRREGLEVRGGAPFEADCEVEVPAGAMHSFKSAHNEITWKLLVKGSPATWPDYERSFPVIVHPNENGNPKT